MAPAEGSPLEAWAGQPCWRILRTGPGAAQSFLTLWQAWKQDPRRPRMLHVVALQPLPVLETAQGRPTAHKPVLPDDYDALALQLAAQWPGIEPGFHRMVFERGQVLLTLCLGDVGELLRQHDFTADAIDVCLHGQEAPWIPDLHAIKSLARLSRRGTRLSISLDGRTPDGQLPKQLSQCGFALTDDAGQLPGTHRLQAVFAPAWQPKNHRAAPTLRPGTCAVIGAGLAGAAVAASLARRGWRVRVFDAAPAPAAGASGLPAGLLAPHSSIDDQLLSRLCRAGVRMSLQQAGTLLREGLDWQGDGLLEHRTGADGSARQAIRPAAEDTRAFTRDRGALSARKREAGLPDDADASWHALAAWIKPAALVRAWLAQPGIEYVGRTEVARLVRQAGGWQLLNTAGARVAQADLVVVCAAVASARLLDPLAHDSAHGQAHGQAKAHAQAHDLSLQPVRGQVSWAPRIGDERLPPFPVNGNGYFLPCLPLTPTDDGADAQGTASATAWLCGSSFNRGESDLAPQAQDHSANFERLRSLLPDAALQLGPVFSGGELQAWVGVRCASADRRPLVGEINDGLWTSTAMGSRGLTFAHLCAELIAARLHREPLPLPRKLAAALDVERRRRR